MCNKAAGLGRCLNKVQQGMKTQLRILQSKQTKGKLGGKAGAATEELQYLINFSNSVTQRVSKAMEHLSDFTFVSMANLTLCRRDSYLAHVKSGLKQDTLSALRQASLNLQTSRDSVLKRAEDDIGRFEDKGQSHGQAGGRGTIDFTLTLTNSQIDKHRIRDLTNQHGNNWVISTTRERDVVD